MVKLSSHSKALIGGSLVLLITFNIFNVLNFFFQFSMARFLSVAEYGILATLFSFIYVLGVFSDSIQTIIAKYSSNEKDTGKLKNLLKKSLRKALKFSFILFLVYAAASIFLSPLLKIPYPLMLMNGLMIFASFLLPVNRGFLQGKKMFSSWGINMIIEGGAKLILAILLVLIGWKVYGALAATIMGFIFALLFSFSSLKKILFAKEAPSSAEGIYQYTAPVFVVLLALTLFYSIDIIIAKIVFSELNAGFYAIASILAKTIFMGTTPISRAMFSISSENTGKKHVGRKILLNSLIILSLILVFALIIFCLFPDLLILIFSGKTAPLSAGILFYLAVAISITSITNLLLFYSLSIGKTKNYFLLLIFPIIECIMLVIFSSSLVQFSIAFIVASVIFLLGSILFLRR